MSSVYAQTYPEIEIDKAVKAPRFYAGKYEINAGLGGIYWKLDNDYKLRFGASSDTPPNFGSKVIGKWSLLADTLVFKIEKRTIYDDRINPVQERPNIIKFKILTFAWSTETDSKTDQDSSVVLTSYCTILLNKEMDTSQLKKELKKTIDDKLHDDRTYDDPSLIIQIERIRRVNEIIQKFFYGKNLFYGTRTYSNGNLMNHL